MRPRTIFAALVAGFFAVALTPAEAAPTAELHTFYGTTTQGKTVSGMAFNNYVVYEPPADAWSTTLTYRMRPSMFVLSIKRDGSVADAKPIQGLGNADLNARAVKWLKKWRFRPNSVTEVRMPFAYGQTWR